MYYEAISKNAGRVWQEIVFSIILSIVFGAPAFGQTIPSDKRFDIINTLGVNLHDLQFSYKYSDISIGSGQFPSKMQFVREYNQFPAQPVYNAPSSISAPFASHSSHNYDLTANCFPCDMGTQITSGGATYITGPPGEHIMTVKAFDGIHSFTSTPAYWGTPRSWTNRYGDGATLTDDGSHVVLTTKAGDQISFSHTEPSGAGIACGGACAVALYAVFASGEAIVFSYDKMSTPAINDVIFWYPTLGQSAWGASRLTSVVNSRGYGLAFQYLNPSITSGDMQTRTLVSKISGFRASCLPGVVSCASGSLPAVDYSYSIVGTQAGTGYNVYRLASFKDSTGSIFRYDYLGPEFRLSRAYPANSTQYFFLENTYDQNKISVPLGYYTGKVASQKDAVGKTTSYSGGNVYNTTNPSSTTVTAADSSTTVYSFQARRGFKYTLPSEIDLPLGKVVKYTYDSMLRLTSATDASGIVETYTLDDRGNVTSLVQTPKAGSSELATTQIWSFPSCSNLNPRTCNKSQYYVDGRSKRTDYSYSSDHGGLLAVLSPADSNNRRSVKRFSYSTFYPAPNVTAPSGYNLAVAYLATAEDTCRSSTVLGTDVNFEFACPVADRIRTQFIYTPSIAVSRTNFELEGRVEDSDGALARTCYRYDAVGNRIAETKPKGTGATCS